MGMILAIDPGACSGFAYFADTRLVSCGVFGERPSAANVHLVVIERPQVYVKREVDLNDLVTLGIFVGRLTEFYSGCDVEHVLPREWKGQMPKDISWARSQSKLSADEMRIVPVLAKTTVHNMRDAIGIGLWKCGR
jgi:hypothetical protein